MSQPDETTAESGGPNRKKFTVLVTQEVEVTINTDEMDESWMADYRKSFHRIDSVEGHAKNLAWLAATGLVRRFTEGYGVIRQDGNEPYPPPEKREPVMDIDVTITDDAYEIEVCEQ